MILRDFLKNEARIGDIVVIRKNGWQIGMTRIDNDGLYLTSLNPRILDEYEVIHSAYERPDWTAVDMLVVNTLPTTEVTEYVRKRMVSR